MANVFYLFVAVLPLDNHWFWRMELLGTFTVMKLLGLICLGLAITQIKKAVIAKALQCAASKWFLAFITIQCTSFLCHSGELSVDSAVYSGIFALLSLFITVVIFVDSYHRLYRTVLIAIGGAAFASLYTIRGQQLLPDALDLRPSGIFEDANYYAMVTGLWIPLAFVWALGLKSLVERVYCAACLAVMMLGTTFAASRGGFLGLCGAMLFVTSNSRHRLRNVIILACLAIPLLTFSPSSPLRRFQNPSYGDEKAKDARIIAWTAGLRMIRLHPLIGVGLGNFKRLVARYERNDSTVVSVAHNTWLETAAELGVPALILHVAIMVSSFLALGRCRRRASREGLRDLERLVVGLQAGIISYAISATFVSSWWQKIPWLLIFLAVTADTIMRTRARRLAAVSANRGAAVAAKA